MRQGVYIITRYAGARNHMSSQHYSYQRVSESMRRTSHKVVNYEMIGGPYKGGVFHIFWLHEYHVEGLIRDNHLII